MAIKTYSLTLTGVAQRLSDVLGGGVNVAPPALDVPCREITLQAGGANAGAIFVGDGAGVTSSLWGVRLPAAVAGEPAAPFMLEPGGGPGCPLKLSDLYVIGTNADVLHALIVPF